jgi:hypothetical protein
LRVLRTLESDAAWRASNALASGAGAGMADAIVPNAKVAKVAIFMNENISSSLRVVRSKIYDDARKKKDIKVRRPWRVKESRVHRAGFIVLLNQ